MYLSYSGYKKLECDFAYWNEYINRTKTAAVDDRLGSVYGSAVGKLFEDFFKLKLWRVDHPQATLMGRVEQTVDDILKKETTPWKDRSGGVLLWKGEGPGQNPKGMYVDRNELVADVRDAVARGLKIIREHRLLGPRTDAEFKLDYVTEEGHTLGGRADFIIERTKPHLDTVIVDGKGSRHRGRYVDPKQLLWYAMLFWLHSVKAGRPKLPDKLAFLFWRSEPHESMDWIDTSEDEVQELYETVKDAIARVEQLEKMTLPGSSPEAARGVFLPKANEQNCRFCPYVSLCPPGQKVQDRIKHQEEQRRSKRKSQ